MTVVFSGFPTKLVQLLNMWHGKLIRNVIAQLAFDNVF